MSTSEVCQQRQELRRIAPIYELISDALAGEAEVKRKKATYLPVPSACRNNVNDERYAAYLKRALYYNMTAPTRDALVGQIFLRPPVVEAPDIMQVVLDNMNGEGLNFNQLARCAANSLVPFGRGGLLTDFPPNEGEITVGDIRSGEKRPIIRFFEPWSIRNWRVSRHGTTWKLSLLVLDELYETANSNNEFDVEVEVRQRVYRLIDDCCSVEIYEDGKSVEHYEICDSTGEHIGEIPFDFIGSENNDPDIDVPPFENLATLNIAHYRNSADYEESVYLTGQPTLVLSGLTQEWVNQNFKDGIKLGSREAVPLPEKGVAMLLQAQANQLAYEAMTHKEEQMIAVGAKITRPTAQSVERKEAEIELEAASQKSVLQTIKDNLELALISALKRAGSFIGEELTESNLKVELNENFDLRTMTSDELRSVMEAYDGHKLAFSEMREALRRSGLGKLTDAEAQTAIENDLERRKKIMEEMTPKQDEVETQPVGTKPEPKPNE